jgi:hypothetical protein
VAVVGEAPTVTNAVTAATSKAANVREIAAVMTISS